MGATPSREEPAKKEVIRADGDQGFFSSLWLCGGGDAVDDKAIEKVRRHNDRNGEIRGRAPPASRVNDATRVTESADLFVRERGLRRPQSHPLRLRLQRRIKKFF